MIYAAIKALQDLERVRQFINDVPTAAAEYAFAVSPAAKVIYESGWKEFDVALGNLQRDFADSASIQDIKRVRELYFSWMQNVGDSLIQLGDELGRRGAGQGIEKRLRGIAQVEAQIQYIPKARQIIRDLYQARLLTQPRNIELATGLSSKPCNFIVVCQAWHNDLGVQVPYGLR